MTNRKIKKHKEELCTIIIGANISETKPLKERRRKLIEGTIKAQKLADDVSAAKYLGTSLEADSKATDGLDENKHKAFFQEQVESFKSIFDELCRNIDYTLQREMMFNACVSAKWSCLFAAVASIVACVSLILTMCLK